MWCLGEDVLRSVDCGLVVLGHVSGCRLHCIKYIEGIVPRIWEIGLAAFMPR